MYDFEGHAIGVSIWVWFSGQKLKIIKCNMLMESKVEILEIEILEITVH